MTGICGPASLTSMLLIRKLFRRSPIYRSSLYFRVALCGRWFSERSMGHGRETPCLASRSDAFKQTTVRSYGRAHRLRTLVETGTYMGEMVFAVRRDFDRIYSIELEPTLWANAAKRLSRYPHVSVLQGDSTDVLPGVLRQLTKPALFWLDGHYSGGLTAKGALNTPIRNELKTILSCSSHRHIILIDDAHCFNGEDDYPTLTEISDIVRALRADSDIRVEDNIIRIV